MRYISVAAAILAVALGGLRSNRPALGTGSDRPEFPTSPCSLALTTTTQVGTNYCGYDPVTHSLAVSCPRVIVRAVYVVPNSVHSGPSWVRDASGEIFDAMAAVAADVEVGMVLFGGDARIVVPFTADYDRVNSSFGMVSAGHATPLRADGVSLALRMLDEARDESGPAAGEVVVIFAEHKDVFRYDVDQIYAVQRLMRSSDAFFAIGCPAEVYPTSCELPRQLNPNLGVYAEARRSDVLANGVADYVKDVGPPAAAELAAGVRLPIELEYRDVRPEPDVLVDGAGTSLVWRWSPPPVIGVTLTYSVLPSEVGTWPLSFTGLLTDSSGRTAVVTNTLLVTRGVECATPSPTVTPSATATASPTATLQPPPTSGPSAVYLPLLLSEEPCWKTQPLDVAVVLDTSSSMLEERPSKLEEAREAITAFVDNLKSTDKVAVVTFNSDAQVVQELTNEHPAAIAAVWAVQTGQTTRLDLGIQAAADELTSSRGRADAESIMIVLTDGLPNPVGPAEVLREAGLAKDAGIMIFTIGLGADVDRQLLVSAASSLDLYSEAPTGADLKEIYQGLLVRVPCDPRIYWGRR